MARLRVQPVRSAYRQVADELRRQIVGGVLATGERLPNETELGRAFGVSRSTVREALRVLASQHLIETTRGVHGGSFVSSPDPSQVIEDIGGVLGALVMTPQLRLQDLMEARLLLEPAAAYLAAERADADTAGALRDAVETVRDHRDPTGFASHIGFHTTLLMATGNLMITVMGQPVNDVLRTRLHRIGAERAEWDEVDTCHRAIAEHIAASKPEQAEQEMRNHLLALRSLYERDSLWTDEPPLRT